MTTDPRQSRKTQGRLRRFGVLTGLSGLLAALAVVVAPVAAHAAVCGNEPELGDAHFVDEHNDLRVFHIRSVQEVFNFVQGFNFNNQTSPVSLGVQQAVTQSMTFTLSTTDTLTVEQTRSALQGALTNKTSLSSSITSTFTTTTGQTTTASITVQPFGRVQLDRGAQTIDTVYDLDTWEIGQGQCWYLPAKSPHGVFVKVPTTVEEWRTLFYPIVNPSGVVNAVNFSGTDIHPTTTVAIFGLGFAPPSDRVIVRQGGNQFTIQSGSAWWFDGPGQINATLPGLQPGPASVNVISTSQLGTALQSNTVSITINP